MISDELHALIGEVGGRIGGVADPQRVERILEAHHAEPHRTVPEVRVPRLGDRVEVDVDYIIEHPHGSLHRRRQTLAVDPGRRHVRGEVHRAEVAHRRLVAARVEQDLGAEVGAVHHARVVLRAADVRRVFPREPRMPGLEEHGEHLPPEVERLHALRSRYLARVGRGLVAHVALAEGCAVEVVQIGDVVG